MRSLTFKVLLLYLSCLMAITGAAINDESAPGSKLNASSGNSNGPKGDSGASKADRRYDSSDIGYDEASNSEGKGEGHCNFVCCYPAKSNNCFQVDTTNTAVDTSGCKYLCADELDAYREMTEEDFKAITTGQYFSFNGVLSPAMPKMNSPLTFALFGASGLALLFPLFYLLARLFGKRKQKVMRYRLNHESDNTAHPPTYQSDLRHKGEKLSTLELSTKKNQVKGIAKIKSFAYYLHSDFSGKLAMFDGQVDLLIVNPIPEFDPPTVISTDPSAEIPLELGSETLHSLKFGKLGFYEIIPKETRPLKQNCDPDQTNRIDADNISNKTKAFAETCTSIAANQTSLNEHIDTNLQLIDPNLQLAQRRRIQKHGTRESLFEYQEEEATTGNHRLLSKLKRSKSAMSIRKTVELTILANIDIFKFDKCLTLSSSAHILKRIEKVFRSKPFDGLVLTSLDYYIRLHGRKSAILLVNSIFTKYPHKILLIEGGHLIFEKISDLINGIVLINPTLLPSGKVKVRHIVSEYEAFSDYLSKLNAETTLRDNFVTLVVERLEDVPTYPLLVQYKEWVMKNNFIGWISSNDAMCNPYEVRDLLRFEFLENGALTLTENPAYKQLSEKVNYLWNSLPQNMIYTSMNSIYCPAHTPPTKTEKKWAKYLKTLNPLSSQNNKNLSTEKSSLVVTDLSFAKEFSFFLWYYLFQYDIYRNNALQNYTNFITEGQDSLFTDYNLCTMTVFKEGFEKTPSMPYFDSSHSSNKESGDAEESTSHVSPNTSASLASKDNSRHPLSSLPSESALDMRDTCLESTNAKALLTALQDQTGPLNMKPSSNAHVEELSPLKTLNSIDMKLSERANSHGHAYIGNHMISIPKEKQLLRELGFLRAEGHFLNIAALVSLEEPPKQLSLLQNNKRDLPDRRFSEIMDFLNHVIQDPSSSAQKILDMFKNTLDLRKEIGNLKTYLHSEKIQLWIVDKRTLFYKNDVCENYYRFNSDAYKRQYQQPETSKNDNETDFQANKENVNAANVNAANPQTETYAAKGKSATGTQGFPQPLSLLDIIYSQYEHEVNYHAIYEIQDQLIEPRLQEDGSEKRGQHTKPLDHSSAVMHIYIEDGGRGFIESVLYCYFKYLGLSPQECTIIENLVTCQENLSLLLNFKDNSLPSKAHVSRRILAELELSDYQDFAYFIINTPVTVARIKSEAIKGTKNTLNKEQKMFLLCHAQYIYQYAREQLLEKSAKKTYKQMYLRRLTGESFEAYETNWYSFLGRSLIDSENYKTFDSLCMKLSHVFDNSLKGSKVLTYFSRDLENGFLDIKQKLSKAPYVADGDAESKIFNLYYRPCIESITANVQAVDFFKNPLPARIPDSEELSSSDLTDCHKSSKQEVQDEAEDIIDNGKHRHQHQHQHRHRHYHNHNHRDSLKKNSDRNEHIKTELTDDVNSTTPEEKDRLETGEDLDDGCEKRHAEDDNSSNKHACALHKDLMFTIFLFKIIQSTIQRLLMEDLCSRIQQKNAVPLPEADQIAVGLEMQISKDRVVDIFGENSNELGKVMNIKLRRQVLWELENYSRTHSQTKKNHLRNMYGQELTINDKVNDKFGMVFHRLSSGMFFTLPALFDVILIMVFGSGLFSSGLMSKSGLNTVNFVFMISFTTTGGIMSGIARSCAYYFSQYSVVLMMITACRRFVSGFLFAVALATFSLLFIMLYISRPYAPIAFFYCLFFSMFLILIAGLYIMQTGESWVLANSGPQRIFICMLTICTPVIIVVSLTYAKIRLSFDPIFIYLAFLAFAVLFLGISYRQVVHYWLVWPKKISITSKASIEVLYAEIVPRPKPQDFSHEQENAQSVKASNATNAGDVVDAATKYEKLAKIWERDARRYFMRELKSYKDSSLLYKVFNKKYNLESSHHHIIKQRHDQRRREKLLMAWYLMRSGQKKPMYASFAWDVMLQQAIDDMKKKYSIEKVNRGGLLFGFEMQPVIFGCLYFFIIFIDRWTTMFSGHGITMWIPSGVVNKDYIFGMGWATIFMLLSASTFEINLFSIATHKFKPARIGVEDAAFVLSNRKHQKSKMYYKEVFRFCLGLSINFLITTSLFLMLGKGRMEFAYYFYFIGIFGFLGILVGIFHKLFLVNQDKGVNYCLLAGNTLGLVVGIGLTLWFRQEWLAISSLVISGWVFGISTFFLHQQNVVRHMRVPLTPALLSSGQSYFGPLSQTNEPYVRANILKRFPKKMNHINPTHSVGQYLTQQLLALAPESQNKTADNSQDTKRDQNIYEIAFPLIRQHVKNLNDAFVSEKVLIYLVPFESLIYQKGKGYSAISRWDKDTDRLLVYVGMPGRQSDFNKSLVKGKPSFAEPQTYFDENEKEHIMNVNECSSEFPMLQLILEALLHEYLEQLGVPHTHAILGEMLASDKFGSPLRMRHEVQNQKTSEVIKVYKNLKAELLMQASFGVNLANQWIGIPTCIAIEIVRYYESFYLVLLQTQRATRLRITGSGFDDSSMRLGESIHQHEDRNATEDHVKYSNETHLEIKSITTLTSKDLQYFHLIIKSNENYIRPIKPEDAGPLPQHSPMDAVQAYETSTNVSRAETLPSMSDFLKVYISRSLIGVKLALSLNIYIFEVLQYRDLFEKTDYAKELQEYTSSDDKGEVLGYKSWISYEVENFFRLLFMAANADPRFGRELAFGFYSMKIAAPILRVLYFCARTLNKYLFLWMISKNERIAYFLERTRSGLRREKRYQKGKLNRILDFQGHQVNSVFVDDPHGLLLKAKRFFLGIPFKRNPNVMLVKSQSHHDKMTKTRKENPADLKLFKMLHYTGIHNSPPSESPLSQSEYYLDAKFNRRLYRQLDHSSSGKTQTTFYSNQITEGFPNSCFVYEGNVTDIYDGRDNLHEIHFFNPCLGRVEEAILCYYIPSTKSESTTDKGLTLDTSGLVGTKPSLDHSQPSTFTADCISTTCQPFQQQMAQIHFAGPTKPLEEILAIYYYVEESYNASPPNSVFFRNKKLKKKIGFNVNNLTLDFNRPEYGKKGSIWDKTNDATLRDKAGSIPDLSFMAKQSMVSEAHGMELQEFNEKNDDAPALYGNYIPEPAPNRDQKNTLKRSLLRPSQRHVQPHYIEKVTYTHLTHGWTMTIVFTSPATEGTHHRIKWIDYLTKEKDLYRAHYLYDHPVHPFITTMKIKSGQIHHYRLKCATPLIITQDPYRLIGRELPRNYNSRDVLFNKGLKKSLHQKILFNMFFGWRNVTKQYFTDILTTQEKRVELWTEWRSGNLEGAIALELDELFLRDEPLLYKYWKYRDNGKKKQAQNEIGKNLSMLSKLFIPDTPSTRTHLQYRLSDLLQLGVGGDSNFLITDRLEDQESANSECDENYLQVLSLDSGTWPTGGGGVGSCRRDLIERLAKIRWTAMAEIGTDAEMVQRGYFVEQNINAIYYQPLWGLDLNTPNQHILIHKCFGELVLKELMVSRGIIVSCFAYLLEELIYAIANPLFESYHLDDYADLFVKLHLYFQKYDWVLTWSDPKTKEIWYTTWFKIYMQEPNRLPPRLKRKLSTKKSKDEKEMVPKINADRDFEEGQSSSFFLMAELPSLDDLENSYDLLLRLLFPIASPIPRKAVVHASHHGIQSLMGVIATKLYGSSLIIWDHGILWRERLLTMANLDTKVMSKFVQLIFTGLTKISSFLSYGHAFAIVPCTSVQNIQWELWLGGLKYNQYYLYKNTWRRISPILNGMVVDRFNLNYENESLEPTSIMLSHVNRIKDVMNAIYAASIIVSKYKIKTYRLLIYGSLVSDPIYANACANLIVSLSLSENVFLCGVANPSVVTSQGWCFVNSSISEGLPLAIGEAGLCGLPIVCTDVGGSREVLMDDPKHIYGKLVPPSSPALLAAGQLQVMAMLDGLEETVVGSNASASSGMASCIMGEETSGPSNNPLSLEYYKDKPERLYERMMNPKTKNLRRNLGLALRARVFRVFGIDRYLRQHGQLMWAAAIKCKDIHLVNMVHRYIYRHNKKFRQNELKKSLSGLSVDARESLAALEGERQNILFQEQMNSEDDFEYSDIEDVYGEKRRERLALDKKRAMMGLETEEFAHSRDHDDTANQTAQLQDLMFQKEANLEDVYKISSKINGQRCYGPSVFTGDVGKHIDWQQKSNYRSRMNAFIRNSDVKFPSFRTKPTESSTEPDKDASGDILSS